MVGDKEHITFEDTTKLVYINQAVKESLRLYPPAPGSARQIAEEVTVDGFRFPKGSAVIVSTCVYTSLCSLILQRKSKLVHIYTHKYRHFFSS